MASRDFGDAYPTEVGRTTIKEESWLVKRGGKVEEIRHSNSRLTYRVKIWDAGREAFITENFNDVAPAVDFLDRVRDENESHSRMDHE